MNHATVLTFACLLAGATAGISAPRYRVTDLGVLSGFTDSGATALNDAGQVVGYCAVTDGDDEPATKRHAVIFQFGAILDIGTLGGDFSTAWAINNRGEIVGGSNLAPYTNEGIQHAFYFKNGMTDLGTLGGSNSCAYDINNRGEIVGDALSINNAGSYAFLYKNGRMTRMGGSTEGFARAINDSGTIVGSIRFKNASRAAIFRTGKVENLGALPRSNGSYRYAYSDACAINASGQIVGASGFRAPEKAPDVAAQFLSDGRILGYESRGYVNQALGINNRGQMVGVKTYVEYMSGDPTDYAVIIEDGRPQLLINLVAKNPAIFSITRANAINNRGQIAGIGRGPSGYRAVLLTPIATVTIDGKPTRTTARTHLKIKGHASGSVARVEYRIGKSGPFHRAIGTHRWHFNARLKPGKNVITVRSRSSEGDSGPDSIAVTLR